MEGMENVWDVNRVVERRVLGGSERDGRFRMGLKGTLGGSE